MEKNPTEEYVRLVKRFPFESAEKSSGVYYWFQLSNGLTVLSKLWWSQFELGRVKRCSCSSFYHSLTLSQMCLSVPVCLMQSSMCSALNLEKYSPSNQSKERHLLANVKNMEHWLRNSHIVSLFRRNISPTRDAEKNVSDLSFKRDKWEGKN